jgi:pantetheine-phosphate adenylyltransferase
VTLALYPGKFDPVTNGHLDIIDRAHSLFDEVIVGVVKSSSTVFSTDERVELLRQSAAGIPNVRVEIIPRLTVEFAHELGAKALVRGIRAVTDFEYEFDMALMNKKMQPEIDSIFLMTNVNYLFVSASRIRALAGFGRDISEFVPPVVAAALQRKYGLTNGGA